MYKFILNSFIQDMEKSEDLKKGEKGDWKKEGYTLEHATPQKDTGGKFHTIHATDSKGDEAGKYEFFEHDNHSVHGPSLTVQHATTYGNHKRKGLASAAYKHIENKTGKKIIRTTDDQSKDAKKLWANKGRKFGKSEKFNQPEEDVNLVHYSPEQGLKTIEPKYHGVRGIGAEVRHTSPEHKTSFYYTEGTKPEDIVVSGAKSKYTAKLGDRRIYDIATDPEGVISAAKEKTNEKSINRGIFTHDDMHHAIKSAGYHGFKNSSLGSQMGNVIAMYHPMAIHQEEPIEFGKSENDLEKGLKSSLAGIGLAASLAMSPMSVSQHTANNIESSQERTPSPEKNSVPAFGSQPEDHFLHNVMQVETSGGTNLKHPKVKYGLQRGTTAVGKFALMPNTIKEIANRYRLQGNNHPEVSAIHQMPVRQVGDYVSKNPHVELELARSLARHVVGRHGNNERAAYAWKYGHNLTPRGINKQKLANDPYTKNFAILNRGQSVEGLTPASVAFGSRGVAGDIKKTEDLEKGINGDWKSEGYKIKVREGKYGHGVYAYGPDRKRVGHALIGKYPSNSGHLRVHTSEIQEPHQGKGLYQAMLQAAADHAKSLGHKGIMSEGFQRSPDATRAWEKVSHRTIDSGYPTTQSHKQPDGSWEDVKVHTPRIDHYLDKAENTNDGDDFDHSPSDPAEFHQALIHHASKNPYIKDSVHIYSPEEYASSKTFLSKDKKSGYALKPDGELMSVFSGEKGRGDHLMNSAIKNGAMHLDAFDGYLPKFYSRHGFKEHKRERNWTEGGPDVVYMKRDPMAMVKSENSLLPKPSTPQQLTGPVESSDVQQPLAASSSVQQAPKHSEKVRSIAESYMKSKGQTLQHPTSKVKVDPAFGAKVATAYDQMPHNPHDPEVKAAYQALNKETLDQFNHIMSNSGLKISKMKSGMPNPYMNSKDMTKDIHENNHLWYYPSDEGFGSSDFIPTEHPSLTPTEHLDSEGKPMLANDLFRIVHDYFGHAKEGNTFNHDGEENAYLAHRAMFSPLAARAMSANTRGQNSWVNFGPHGEHNRKNPAKTIYADQKVGLLPEWAEQPNLPMKKSESDKVKSFMRHPREIYNDKKNESKRKIIAEKERQKTGAKKPLDIAMDKLKVDKAEMPKLPIAPKPFKTGDRVNHVQHGAGTVRQNHGDGHLTVGFDNSKDTSLNYKGLKVHSNDFKKSEIDLVKMSQPIPSFPKIKSVTTRPDSEIKPLEEKTYTLPPKNDKQSKYDGTYGMPRKFSQGDYAAKKFQAKMGKENPDVAETVKNNVDSVAQGDKTHGSVISTGDKRVIMGQYNAKTDDSTKMHEAYHFTTKQIGQKLGLNEQEIGKISSHLLNHIHPDDYKAFRTIITARGYDPRRPDFDEEVVAHMGNYLNDKNFRESAHSAHLRSALINAPEEALAMHNLVRNPHETLNPNRFKAGYKSLIRAAKDLDEKKIYEIIGNK